MRYFVPFTLFLDSKEYHNVFFGKKFYTTREICNRREEVAWVSEKKTEAEIVRWRCSLQHA